MKHLIFLLPGAVFIFLLCAYIPAFHSAYQRRADPSSYMPVSTVMAVASGTIAESHKTIFLTMDMDMNEAMLRKYQKGLVQEWYDPRIFAYLEKERIPATFFVSGLFAETYPDLMRSLASTTMFSFQNHSYDESGFIPHCYWLTPLVTPQEKIAQIEETQTILEHITGQKPRYFRYPGLCSGKGDDALVQSLGLEINEGNIFASDPFNPDGNRIANHILARLKNNGVILMHIGGPNAPASYDVLRKIVPAIRARGYIFEKL